jgi:hypothetical protein
MNHCETIERRKSRWLEFYRPDASIRRLYWIHCYPSLPDRPWPLPDLIDERIDWSWQKYQLLHQRLDWLEDDSLPFLDIFTGTEIFAEAFGCQIYYPDNDMPFARPLVNSASEADRLEVPAIDCPPLARVWRIARELRRRAGPGALVRLPDIQSPMDIAALIWEKTSFYPAMLDDPDSVLRLAHKVHLLLTAFLDAWFAEFGTQCIAHYPEFYVPRGITLSEDEVGAVSAAHFQRFFLPELADLSDRYGAIGMHCCANSRHQWDAFKTIPGLFLININQPLDVTHKAYSFFADHAAQMHICALDGPAWTWPGQVPLTSRVVFEIGTSTQEEAVELLRKIREVEPQVAASDQPSTG